MEDRKERNTGAICDPNGANGDSAPRGQDIKGGLRIP